MLKVNNILLSNIVKYINDFINYFDVLGDVVVFGFFLIRICLKKD